ncbi:hypothetical protein B2G74_00200 [Burkholderia sp. A27]|nr:hypothetical protein B2G74_00200 [Burkholderia sp. A27]
MITRSAVKFIIYSQVRYIGAMNAQETIKRGDIGYIIEVYSDGNYEVEFSGSDGTTRALVVIEEHDLELAEK